MKKVTGLKRVSWKVVRRTAGTELLDIVAWWGAWACSGGRSIYNQSSFPSQSAYWAAVSRLGKKGLLVRRRSGGRTPFMELTDEGRARLVSNPETKWKLPWDGVWYLLSYDIPERDRGYRDVLRAFLKRHRMGCLHHSTWITPQDVRPEYHDLCEGASVGGFAVLLHAQAAFGTDDDEIVRKAWPWEKIERAQDAFIDRYSKVLDAARSGRLRESTLRDLPIQELRDYIILLDLDPLLPRQLWPRGYRGPELHAFHKSFVRDLQRCM
jgi:phenylacetic acid degradation operon negative regulatory protein